MKPTLALLTALLLAPLAGFSADEKRAFPYMLPDKKPDMPLSPAMERLYDNYLAPTPEANGLYSTFKFTPLEGFDYHNADGTISRRDPSKVTIGQPWGDRTPRTQVVFIGSRGGVDAE